jgi:NAD(P)-dependent dehydrogenase (short-subunit alcohol dehydrogenase family)
MKLAGLDGRTALVTGAGRGIGRRIAETLAALGSSTAGGDLEAPRLDGVLGVALDVTSEESVDRAFTAVERRLGAVDIVVLNAGVFEIESLLDTTFESWRRTMAVNVDGAFCAPVGRCRRCANGASADWWRSGRQRQSPAARPMPRPRPH